jgi:hypothetical protein
MVRYLNISKKTVRHILINSLFWRCWLMIENCGGRNFILIFTEF